MRKRLFIFGLIICLILVSGWTGRTFPFHSYDAGEIYYQSDHSAGSTGMTGAPLSDKTVWVSANELFFKRGTEQKLVPVATEVNSSFDRVSYAENQQVIVSDSWDNDQLELIVMAPRA